MAQTSERRRAARQKRREDLVKFEGEEHFEGIQSFLATVHKLGSEKRLSRFVICSRKINRPGVLFNRNEIKDCATKGEDMKFKLLSVISIAGFLFSGNFFVGDGTSTPSYGFDVSIVPDQQVSDAYQAKLVVKELDSNTVVAAPTIRFRAGQTANTTTAGETNGVNFQFSVAVNEKSGVAEYDAAVLQAKTIVSRSQGKISLRK